MDKVLIMGDSVAHGGHPIHPSIMEPPISIEDDEEGEEQEEEDSLSMDPSAVQDLIVSAFSTASAATGAQFPHPNTLSDLPTTSLLIDKFHVPDDMMEINPMPKITGNHLPILLLSTTPLEEVTTSTFSGIKCKFHPTICSAPSLVISAAHLVPTTFTPSSSDPSLSLSLLAPSTTRPHHLELQYHSIHHLLAVLEGAHEAALRKSPPTAKFLTLMSTIKLLSLLKLLTA